MTLYDRFAVLADRLLKQYGAPLTIRRVSRGGYDRAERRALTSETSQGGVGCVFPIAPGVRNRPNSLFEEGDEQLLLSKFRPDGAPLDPGPAVNDIVQVASGALYTIKAIETLSPAGSSVIHDCTVRLGGALFTPTYDPDAQALWARRLMPPTDAEKAADHELIVGLKADGIWPKLDLLKIRTQSDEQAARLDYVNPAWDEVAVNSPSFLRNQGFIGDALTSYLDGGFDPAAAPGAKYKQADCHMSVWLGTDIGSSSQYDCGHARSLIVGRNGTNSNTAAIRANQTGGVNYTLPVPTSIGWLCFTRDNALSFRAVKDDAPPTTLSQAAAGLAINQTFLSLAARSAAGAPANFSGRLQRVKTAGGSLSNLDLANFYGRLKRRLEQAGAI